MSELLLDPFSLFLYFRSFENNLNTYKLLSHHKIDTELPNVSQSQCEQDIMYILHKMFGLI